MSGFCVLVVDDEERILNFIRIKLRASGYDVLTARDGVRAVEQVRTNEADAMVLDLVMPRKDGIKTLKEVRSISSIPIIVISARTNELEKARNLHLPDVEILPKPFQPEDLVARIESIRFRKGKAIAEKVNEES